MDTNPQKQPVFIRSSGVTGAERHLQKLCDHSFLSFWSYSGVYRDQGSHVARGGDGKEVCDILVVFDDHIIIFSDKDCAFPDTGDLNLDWKRWYKKAIRSSAEQIWGAENWIKKHPDRIFTDRLCTQKLPINLPAPHEMIFHRVIVAHGAAERCKKFFADSGSGSLVIDPDIIGDAHMLPVDQGGYPFKVGQVDLHKGFVHILDDTSLDILLETLDTITDFVAYLTRKEKFALSGKLGVAAGEEELLAFYLKNLNEDKEHDFVVPADIDKVWLDEGLWDEFATSQPRKNQVKANEVSYVWDKLIEKFLYHVFTGTQYHTTHPGVENLSAQETIFRVCARENRVRRRMLGKSIMEMVHNTGKTQKNVRVFKSMTKGEPCYVFLLLPRLRGISVEEYREVRQFHLHQYCMVAKLRFPEAEDIIGIATESDIGSSPSSSEDIAYLSSDGWTEEDAKQARRIARETGILADVKEVAFKEFEYPQQQQRRPIASAPRPIFGPARRQPCPCGSGKKYKNCCEKKRRP